MIDPGHAEGASKIGVALTTAASTVAFAVSIESVDRLLVVGTHALTFAVTSVVAYATFAPRLARLWARLHGR